MLTRWGRASGTLVALLLLATLPASGAGQTEVVFDAGVAGFLGRDFTGLRPGPALATSLFVTDWITASAGVEVVYGQHAGPPVESATHQVDIAGMVFRRLEGGSATWLVGGKIGIARRWLSLTGEPARTEGFLIGPSVVRRFSLRGARVQVGVDALYQTFEELTMYGSREYGTDEDGFRLAVRAGVVLPLASLLDGEG